MSENRDLFEIEDEAVDQEYLRLLEQERLIVRTTERIARALREKGISRSKLADLIGRTRPYVTRVLGGHNMTLRTLADIAGSLGYRVNIEFEGMEPTVITMEQPEIELRHPRARWQSAGEPASDSVIAA